MHVINYSYGYIMPLSLLPLHGSHIVFKLTGVHACMKDLAKFVHVLTLWQRRSWPIKIGYKHEEAHDLNYSWVKLLLSMILNNTVNKFIGRWASYYNKYLRVITSFKIQYIFYKSMVIAIVMLKDVIIFTSICCFVGSSCDLEWTNSSKHTWCPYTITYETHFW